MTWQWIGLAIFSLALLPAGLAMVGGWAPRLHRAHRAHRRHPGRHPYR
ncbi:hypothetical protein [Streptomyces sp. NPDC000880]